MLRNVNLAVEDVLISDPEFLYQQDNVSVHARRVTENFLQEQNIMVLVLSGMVGNGGLSRGV